MAEDIIKIISNGFETYTKNLNLSIPFVLNIFITGLLSLIMFAIGFFYIFGSSLASFEKIVRPEDAISIIIQLISHHIFEIIFLILIVFFIILFIDAFFMAGAIGMAKQATETGKCQLSTMIEAGKKNLVNLFLAEILIWLLYLAGIVFIVPGALKIDFAALLSPENTAAAFLLIAGFLLWALYLIILSVVLAVVSYALVVDNLGPVEGINSGFRFFTKYKFDVFLLWLITFVVIVVLTIIGEVLGLIPIINIIWPIINLILSAVVIPPLLTVWWVRLYMTRMDKKIYINELLEPV